MVLSYASGLSFHSASLVGRRGFLYCVLVQTCRSRVHCYACLQVLCTLIYIYIHIFMITNLKNNLSHLLGGEGDCASDGFGLDFSPSP